VNRSKRGPSNDNSDGRYALPPRVQQERRSNQADEGQRKEESESVVEPVPVPDDQKHAQEADTGGCRSRECKELCPRKVLPRYQGQDEDDEDRARHVLAAEWLRNPGRKLLDIAFQ